jgi:hypothetical protein
MVTLAGLSEAVIIVLVVAFSAMKMNWESRGFAALSFNLGTEWQ